MKKFFKGKTAVGTALLALLLAVIIIVPLSVGAGDNPGEGNIPIPKEDGYSSESSGQATPDADIPTGLAAGQVWTDKEVTCTNDEYGTFEITLYAWGAVYTDEAGDDVLPLDPEDQILTMTDTIGDMFEYDADTGADNTVGTFSVTDGVATWVISQDDITGEIMASCTFKVTLKEDWEIETPYYTNEGAAVYFTPAGDNPYYYTTRKWTETEQKTIELNWNQGNDNGVNSFKIVDTDLGATIESDNINARTNVTVTVSGKAPQTFTLNRTYTSDSQAYTDPVEAADGEWGYFWVRAEAKDKTYQFWFKGIEGPGVVTRYDIAPGNEGGNETFLIEEITHNFSETVKIGDRPWTGEGPEITQPLLNKGVIEIFYEPVTTPTSPDPSPTDSPEPPDPPVDPPSYKLTVSKKVAEFTNDKEAFSGYEFTDEVAFGVSGKKGIFAVTIKNDSEASLTLTGIEDKFNGADILSDADVFYLEDGTAVSIEKIIEDNENLAAGAEFTFYYITGVLTERKDFKNEVKATAENEDKVKYDDGDDAVIKVWWSIPVVTGGPGDPGDSGGPVTTTTVQTTPPSPAPGPSPTDMTPVDITDDGPPLAEFPFEPQEPEVVRIVELDDGGVPLGDMPATGIESTVSLWLCGICVSMLAAGLLIRVIYRGKKEK